MVMQNSNYKGLVFLTEFIGYSDLAIQPCKVVARLSQGCGIVTCSQPYRVVTTLHG